MDSGKNIGSREPLKRHQVDKVKELAFNYEEDVAPHIRRLALLGWTISMDPAGFMASGVRGEYAGHLGIALYDLIHEETDSVFRFAEKMGKYVKTAEVQHE